MVSAAAKKHKDTDYIYEFLLYQILNSFFKFPYMPTPRYIPHNAEEPTLCAVFYKYMHAVFFVELFPAKYLDIPNERGKADAKMRTTFGKLVESGITGSKLVGMCVIGDRAAYYICEGPSNLEPARVKNGNPPVDWWQKMVDENNDDGYMMFVEKVMKPVKKLADDFDAFEKATGSDVMATYESDDTIGA